MEMRQLLLTFLFGEVLTQGAPVNSTTAGTAMTHAPTSTDTQITQSQITHILTTVTPVMLSFNLPTALATSVATTTIPHHPTTAPMESTASVATTDHTTSIPPTTTPYHSNSTAIDNTTSAATTDHTTSIPPTTTPYHSNSTAIDNTTSATTTDHTTSIPPTTTPYHSNSTAIDNTTSAATTDHTTSIPPTTTPYHSNSTAIDNTTSAATTDHTTSIPPTTTPYHSNSTAIDNTTSAATTDHTTSIPPTTTPYHSNSTAIDNTTSAATTDHTTSIPPTITPYTSGTTPIASTTSATTDANLPTAITHKAPTMSSASPTPSTSTVVPSTTPHWKCVNGQEENGVCLCPDEWTGEFCQKQNFCNGSAVDNFQFSQTVIGRFSYSTEVCKEGTANVGTPMASVQCLDNCKKPCFGAVKKVDCDRTLKDLQNSSVDPVIVANNVQILTSQPERLTAENITEAAEILNKLLESPPDEEVAVAAVTTVSQLLNANFTAAGSVDSDTTNRLTARLEDLSINLERKEALLVQPNLVIQSVRNLGETPGVEFVAQAGQSIQFVPNRINLNTTATGLSNDNKVTPDVQMFLQLKPGRRQASVGFVLYQNDQLFRSVKFKTPLGSTRQVISATMGRGQDLGLVEMRFRPILNATKFVTKPELHDFACVFWDYDTEDWSTRGCQKKKEKSSLGCVCNHTTNFAVLMSWNGHTYAKDLTWISILGCSLSIAGVSLTIAFHILTRKSRKANATILIVGICSSLLAVYFLFLFGINTKEPPAETQNIILHTDEYPERDRGCCTAITALLQYFLLATFTWNTLYATQIFFLIHSTLAQQTRSFTIFALFVGWGFPALVVAVTLGVTYRLQHPLNYRQEEFCWLAARDAEGKLDAKKPMVWGFLIPVALMLLYNCVILVYFTLVTYRPNPMLKSTVKYSPKKTALTSFSLGVILGLSWILGYLLLTGTEKRNYIFSVIFCVFTSTQGLQIFIFFTVRTPAFRKMLSQLPLKVPAPEIYLHHKKFILWGRSKSESHESYKPAEDTSDAQSRT